jgi:hypothetical protein
MIMSNRKPSCFLAAVAAAVAMAVPIGQGAASTRPDDRGLPRGAVVAMPDLVERALAAQARRAAPPDLVDRAVARLHAPALSVAQTSHQRAGNGLGWGAAGVGVATIAAAVLLAAAAFRIARRSRMRSAAA